MMRNGRLRLPLLALCSSLALSLAIGSVGHADEPARDFLDGLRARGYHDIALEYLDQIANNPRVSNELKQVIDMEKAITLINASRSERDSELREKQLDEAQKLLTKFIQKHPQHLKTNTARTQLGNLIVERARLRVEDAEKGNEKPLLAEARKLYEDAYKVFGEQQQQVQTQLEKIPKVLDVTDDEQAKLAERRTQLRADYLQTQLLAAAIREEMADTIEEGSPAHNDLLKQAANQYEDIYKKYRTRLAGLYARMFQGRANQKQGNYRDALGFYVELLDQPDEPEAFRVLKTKTLRLAMDCWLHESQNKFMEAIRRGTEWTLKARAHEEREPDWLYIRLAVARAYLRQAEVAAKADPPNKRVVTSSRNEARKLAQAVARYESEFQKEAQQLVAELGGPDLTNEGPQVRNFAQARKAGSEALDAINPSTTAVNELTRQVAQAKDAAAKKDLQDKLAAAKQNRATVISDAQTYFRLALQLADEETASEDVNLVRYLLSYLYFLDQRNYEAALMGEFVARRYPDSTGARQCAKIAMASYLQLYGQIADPAERQFETDRVVSVSEYIADKWPQSPEAEDALSTLIPFMINADEIDRARQYLDQFPESSSKWPDAALKVGKAMWQKYLTTVQEQNKEQEAGGGASNAEATAQNAELEQLKTETREVLRAGLEKLPKNAPKDESLLTALLSLAQADVETQHPADAIQVLEDPDRGPLTLVRKNHNSTKLSGFREEAYKTALRAYISSLATADDADAAMDKASKLMEEMQAQIGSTPEGQEQLIAVYVGLARDLEEQLRVADPAAKQALSKGFEQFLAQLSNTATELNVLNWVAETFASLGAGFDTGDTLTPEATKYYEQSATAFRNMLDKAEMRPEMQTQVKVRLANVYQHQEKYDDALKIFREILQANNMTLNVQVEAARALQQAGRFQESMTGAFKDPQSQKNIVWGWGKIAQVTARYPDKFKDVFHQARYGLAASRFQLAQTKQGAERTKMLKLAVQDISLTKRLYGLGDESQTQQYDTLLKEIQKSQGKQPDGVKVFDVGG